MINLSGCILNVLDRQYQGIANIVKTFTSYMCIIHDVNVMYVITRLGINLCETDGSFS